jgi:transposase
VAARSAVFRWRRRGGVFPSGRDRRQATAAPVFHDLEAWLREQLARISGKSPLAAAIRYALARMERMRPYLDNGTLELDNNTAERGMRAIALGRKNYLFVGSEAGGKAAAIAYTLIDTAKLNDVDPEAWLADTIARTPDYKITKVDKLLPWNWNR